MKLYFKIYSFLLVLSIYLPDFGIVDMNAAQWLYISILNTTFLLFLVIKNKIQLARIIKNKSFIYFSLFFTFSILSVSVSINHAESLLRLNEIFAVLCSLLLLLNFYVQDVIDTKFILTIISASLGLEVLGSLNQYRLINSYTVFDFSMANEIRGFTGNKNVASASVAFKIPFLILLFDSLGSKKFIQKTLITLLLIASFYVIMLYSARAVFMSISLGMLCFLCLLLLKKLFFKKSLKLFQDYRQPLLYILPALVAILIFTTKYNGDERLAVNNRVESIITNSEDQSIAQRLRFYGHSLNSIKSNPLLGIGIGNWKIYSIKYDAQNMYSYVVPYFAHNDFLEIFAEIGIFGFIFYVLFYFKIFQLNLNLIFRWINNEEESNMYLIAFFPLIIYIVDANLNFPMSRPITQVQLLLYLILLYQMNSIFKNEAK